jgi:hypothetical protein
MRGLGGSPTPHRSMGSPGRRGVGRSPLRRLTFSCPAPPAHSLSLAKCCRFSMATPVCAFFDEAPDACLRSLCRCSKAGQGIARRGAWPARSARPSRAPHGPRAFPCDRSRGSLASAPQKTLACAAAHARPCRGSLLPAMVLCPGPRGAWSMPACAFWFGDRAVAHEGTLGRRARFDRFRDGGCAPPTRSTLRSNLQDMDIEPVPVSRGGPCPPCARASTISRSASASTPERRR